MELRKTNQERYPRRKSTLDLGTMVYGKVPPQAKDIEGAILGAMMVQKDCYDVVSGYLKPDCFYVEAHQRIFSAIQRLNSKSQPVDILTVAEELKASEELELVGGDYYITGLTKDVVSGANIEAHCRIVIQKYIQRDIIRICGELIGEAYEDGADPFDLLDHAEDQLGLVTESLNFGDMVGVDRVLVESIQYINRMRDLNEKREGNVALTGVPSGFDDLDMLTRGWQKGDFIIIAARPSKGKTAFVLNVLKNAAKYLKKEGKGGSVAMWSLEMKAMRLMLRLLAQTSNIWLTKIQTGILTDDDMKMLYKNGVQLLSQLNILFDDQAGLSIQKLRSKARRMKRRNNLSLIIIDYLQLMTPAEKSGNREQEISKISRNLKLLALELDVPIIALSQLSRAVETRTDPTPLLSDLRESGSLEQDADVVIFLYGYSEAEISQSADLKDRRRVKVAKQRDGMLDTVDLEFKSDIQLFETIEKLNHPTGLSGGSWRPIHEHEKGTPMNNNSNDDDYDSPF